LYLLFYFTFSQIEIEGIDLNVSSVESSLLWNENFDHLNVSSVESSLLWNENFVQTGRTVQLCEKSLEKVRKLASTIPTQKSLNLGFAKEKEKKWKGEDEEKEEKKNNKRKREEKSEQETRGVSLCWDIENAKKMTGAQLRIQLILQQDHTGNKKIKISGLKDVLQERLLDLIKKNNPGK
jgi:hypothetical protein